MTLPSRWDSSLHAERLGASFLILKTSEEPLEEGDERVTSVLKGTPFRKIRSETTHVSILKKQGPKAP